MFVKAEDEARIRGILVESLCVGEGGEGKGKKREGRIERGRLL